MKIGRKIVETVDAQEARVDDAVERLRQSDRTALIVAVAVLVALSIGLVLWAL